MEKAVAELLGQPPGIKPVRIKSECDTLNDVVFRGIAKDGLKPIVRRREIHKELYRHGREFLPPDRDAPVD